MQVDYRQPDSSPQLAQDLREVAESSAQHDSFSAFSEQALLALTNPQQELKILQALETSSQQTLGLALLLGEGDSWVLEAAVLPSARNQGIGRTLLTQAMQLVAPNQLRVWIHAGANPQAPGLQAARHLAQQLGLTPVRELHQLALPLSDQTRQQLQDQAQQPPLPAGLSLRSYQEGDGPAWVATNAAAFADHPEQGRLTLADFDQRASSDWFRPEGLILAESPADGLAGFVWTKIPRRQADQPSGEIYVVGVDPSQQGRGLGKTLTLAGLAYLARAKTEEGQPLEQIILYVDGSNAPALALYNSLGFRPLATDTQYLPASSQV